MKKAMLFLFSVVILLFACDKTPMYGDLSNYVGTWQWEKTKKNDLYYLGLETLYLDHFVYAVDYPDTYSIKIKRNGTLVCYENNIVKVTYDLKKTDLTCTECSCFLDTEAFNDITYTRCDGTERIIMDLRFPPFLPVEDGGSVPEITNYFVKVD